MKIIGFIISLFIFNLLILKCFGDSPIPTEKKFEKNSITFIYKNQSDVFSSWIFGSSSISPTKLDFKCSLSSSKPGYKSCVSTFSVDDAKHFKTSIKYCKNTSDKELPCNSQLSDEDYPTPFIDPPFTPSTRAGDEFLQGTFLYYGKTENVFILSGDNLVNPSIVGLLSNSFDPTNITINYNGGCGIGTFLWPNGLGNYTFSHAKPIINDYVIIGADKINIMGNNFCTMQYKDNIVVSINDTLQEIISIDHEKIEIKVTNELLLQQTHQKKI